MENVARKPIHCKVYILSPQNCHKLEIFGFQLLQIATVTMITKITKDSFLFCVDSWGSLALTSQGELALKDVCNSVLTR